MRTRYQQTKRRHWYVITQVLGLAASGQPGVRSHRSQRTWPPNVPVSVGVKNTKGEKVESWKGVNLVHCASGAAVKGDAQVAAACRLSVATGMTCDLDSCSIKIDAVDQDAASRTERYGYLGRVRMAPHEAQRTDLDIMPLPRLRQGLVLPAAEAERRRRRTTSTFPLERPSALIPPGVLDNERKNKSNKLTRGWMEATIRNRRVEIGEQPKPCRGKHFGSPLRQSSDR